MSERTYKRSDGVTGSGYIKEHSGRMVHAICWADDPKREYRYAEHQMRSHKITDTTPTPAEIPDMDHPPMPVEDSKPSEYVPPAELNAAINEVFSAPKPHVDGEPVVHQSDPPPSDPPPVAEQPAPEAPKPEEPKPTTPRKPRKPRK